MPLSSMSFRSKSEDSVEKVLVWEEGYNSILIQESYVLGYTQKGYVPSYATAPLTPPTAAGLV
jgi:hypothetical protein